MSDSSERIWDAAVIGAGPAGSVCAYLLAKWSNSVVLIDKSEFPREKACGDFLIGDSLQVLDRLGFRKQLDNLAQHTTRFSVRYEQGRNIDFSGEFTTLSRMVFDEFLFQQALTAGAQSMTGRATQSARHDSQRAIRVQTHSNGEILARYVVVATGADSSFTRKALHSQHSEANAFAFRKYVVSTMNLEEAIIAYHPAIQPGYGWIIPVDHDGQGYRYNVGAGWPLEGVRSSRNIGEVEREVFADIREADELFSRAVEVSAWSGAPMKCGLSLEDCLPAERVVAIGEAIGTTYPFTGEGIGKAMLSGIFAADALQHAIERDDPSWLVNYRDAMALLEPVYKSFASLENRLTRPRTSRFLFDRLRHSRYLQSIVDDVFHNDASPEPLLRPLTLLRSYWKW